MSDEGDVPSGNLPVVSAAVRAQLLATEHWSLLASRSTTQGEVLTRISMFLTFTSASLLSVALVGQATKFSDTFVMLGLVILSIDLVMGLLTQIRVMNVGMEDLMYVVAMNRLRAAYVELDPGLAPFLMASHHDDEAGSNRTYYFFGNGSRAGHVAGSSMAFMTAANTALMALLLGTLAMLLGAPMAVAVAVGAACGLAFFMLSSVRGFRRYTAVWQNLASLSPTPGEDEGFTRPGSVR